MTSPVILTDAEAALVGGGAMQQTISTSVMQYNTSTVSEAVVATNDGRTSMTTGGFVVSAVAVGVALGNAALVLPARAVEALNNLRLCLY